jgi:hypothetical protein
MGKIVRVGKRNNVERGSRVKEKELQTKKQEKNIREKIINAWNAKKRQN